MVTMQLPALESPKSKKSINNIIIKKPGVAESLQKLVRLNQNQLSELYSKLKNAPKLISNLPNIKDIRIDPYFLKSIFLYSDQRYVSLIKSEDICTFYSLLQNDLIRSIEKRIIKVPIIYRTKSGETESAIVLKSDLLKFIHQTKCFKNKEIATLFAIDSFDKTINNLTYNKPNSEKSCNEIFLNWKSNSYLPFICRIPEVIARANKAKQIINSATLTQLRKQNITGKDISLSKIYLAKIPAEKLSYIKNICFNLKNKTNFCNLYVHADVWRKVISKDLPDYHLNYICNNIMNKQITDEITQLECYERMIQNKSLCSSEGSKKYPALFPKPTCNDIATIKAAGNLYSDYQDCPGRIDNEGTTNIHRILAHFEKKKIITTPRTCLSKTNSTLAKLIYDFDHSNGWPLKICYHDLIKEEDICKPYTPGDINSDTDHNIAETVVVKKILERILNKSLKNRCQIIPKHQYKPHLLKYKQGCYITYNSDECTTVYCPKEILYDAKEIKDKIHYRGNQTYQYFPTSLSNEHYTISNMFKILKKYKNKTINNLTQMTNFLKENNHNIIHGIGCAGDLHPYRFRKTSFNQCRPLPFIIDGTIPDRIKPKVIIRSAIMDIHSPIKLDWNNVYNAVKNYQQFHPTQLWTLYGIIKE